MKNDAFDRKQRSIAILKQKNIPYIEHLPVIETRNEVKIRTQDEIAKRAIACLIVIQLACDISNKTENIEECKKILKNLLHKYGVQHCLTPNEKEILEGNSMEQVVINMIWKYEACWVLLWTLGIVKELAYPSDICDCDFAIQTISKCNSYQEFMQKVKLRNIDEILDQTDLVLRYDWACVDARIKGMKEPQGINSSVVVERHKAFSWLIDFDKDDDWDNASADT